MAEGVVLTEGVLQTEAGDTIPNVIVENDMTIKGSILTPSPFEDWPDPADLSKVTFGGIQGEARFVGPAGMYSPTGTVAVFNGCPVMQMADAATTDVYITIELEEWWLAGSINIPFEWCNMHSATGNVRFQFEIREYDIAHELMSAAGTVMLRNQTIASPAANSGSTTSVVAAVSAGFPFIPAPGPLASFYSLRITRLGNDAADTLGGPIGLIATSWGRAPITG